MSYLAVIKHLTISDQQWQHRVRQLGLAASAGLFANLRSILCGKTASLEGHRESRYDRGCFEYRSELAASANASFASNPFEA